KRDVWLRVIGDCPALETSESSKTPSRFAQLGGSGELDWKPREQVCRGARDPLASLDQSGTKLSAAGPGGSRRTWRLPGRYAFHGLKYKRLLEPSSLGGHSFYLVPVVLAGGDYALAACGEDGSVSLKWR